MPGSRPTRKLVGTIFSRVPPPARGGLPHPRRTVAAVELIVGLGALYGGIGLLDPEGMGARQAWLDGSIFSGFTIPGLFLLVVIGGGMLLAAAMATFTARYGALAALIMGSLLLTWGLVETITLGWLGGAQLVLLGVFVVAPGIALTVVGGRALGSTAPRR